MTKKRKSFTDEFKQDAVQFLTNHPEMTVIECAETLGVGRSTLWKDGRLIPTDLIFPTLQTDIMIKKKRIF